MAVEFAVDPALLPFLGAFLFVFAIVFGLLSYAKMFGFPKNVNAAIALVFGIFAASFEPFRTGLFNILPILVIPLVILFFLVFVKEVFKPKKEGEHFDAFPPVALLAIGLILLGAFWDRINIPVEGLSSSNVLWILGIAVALLVFIVAYQQPAK
ncbi:MAG: hypothetical protein HYW26_03220 [Candidatus Aenigmarchaeota archaeon]|nr:hypothetical protein [Candidatus Aenigmarchaeota archaeon]